MIFSFCVFALQKTCTMSVDSEELIGVDDQLMTLEDDAADSTGTLLLTVDCFEEPSLLPLRKADKSSKAPVRTQKTANKSSIPAEAPLEKRNASVDGPKQRKRKASVKKASSVCAFINRL